MKESFVMVNLALMKELDVSFIEAGLLERIRYFSEYDEDGSGWCYVGKDRLSKEFGLTRKTIYNIINGLIDRGLLEKNEKGWIRQSIGDVKNLHSVEITHTVKKLHKKCENFTHNNNNNNNNTNNKDIIDNYSLCEKNTQSVQNLHGVEITQQKKDQYWNGCKIGSKVPKRKHTIMHIDDFIAYQNMHNRRNCAPIGAPLVWLSSKEYRMLVDEYKSEEFAIEMIREMNKWKSDKKQGMQTNLDDYLAINKPWVAKNAKINLDIKNSSIVDKLRKQEKTREEVRQQLSQFQYTQVDNTTIEI